MEKKQKKEIKKRKVELLVLSDIHLGTIGCQAKELLKYLKSIKPSKVVLNGDIIDVWQFKKKYWPKSHMKIIKHIIGWISQGVEVHYITGNHDELFRKFVGFKMGSLTVENKVVLNLEGKRVWLFHGDVFDVTMQHSKWLVRSGAIGYDVLIRINGIVNYIRSLFGKEKGSFSKKIKNKVKGAVKFINNFETVVTDIAMENGYDYVACGHIHHPDIKTFSKKGKTTIYLNSGDWIENLSALEYRKGKWSVYKYNESEYQDSDNEKDEIDSSTKEVFEKLLMDFNIQ